MGKQGATKRKHSTAFGMRDAKQATEFLSTPQARYNDTLSRIKRDSLYKNGYSFTLLSTHFSDSPFYFFKAVQRCIERWETLKRTSLPTPEAEFIRDELKKFCPNSDVPVFKTVSELSDWINRQIAPPVAIKPEATPSIPHIR